MRSKFKFRLKVGFLILLFIVIGGYSYYKTRDVLQGVKLAINTIKDGQSFSTPAIEIQGSAKNAAYLSLDDRPIFMDKDGKFDESLLLLPGYNIINVKAQDKFGKKVEKNYQLIFKQ